MSHEYKNQNLIRTAASLSEQKNSNNPDNQKQWWTPVWTGLVMDRQAKHYRRMKNTIWLFLYLVLNANRKTGFLLRKVKTVCADMGVPRNTVFRWLNTLRRYGYIATENTGRCLLVQVKKWKTIQQGPEIEVQKHQNCNPGDTKGATSGQRAWGINPVHFGPKKANSGGPNDITINKDILKNDIDDINFGESNLKASGWFEPRNREELLAWDLAEGLNDFKGLPFYLSLSRRFPEPLLRGFLSQARQIPAEKINKSRAALFNHLIQKYAQENSKNHSN